CLHPLKPAPPSRAFLCPEFDGQAAFPDICALIVNVFFFDQKLHFFDANKSLHLSSRLLR
ncbi:hypothetical protein, partial [Pseudomonas meliae]|uniref:hypothetical protein n=1 Tax=Pseudomonas meliae TaxID=86176 RepID=UPI001C3F20CF